jgi:hypothetical protein
MAEVVLGRWGLIGLLVTSARYKIDVFVLSDSGDLNVTNPRLYVGILDPSLETNLIVSGLIRIFCIAIAAIGGLILIGSFVAQRRSPEERDLRSS